MMRLKMLQKSLGVMSGKLVGPKAMFGSLGSVRNDGREWIRGAYLAETGTMRDGKM
jgi:hypothetical protein